jgi:hypothetical protein
MRIRPPGLRATLAAASAAAAIAAVAGYSAQASTASSPANLSAVHSLGQHRTHRSSVTLTSALLRATPSAAEKSAAVCVTSAQRGHCQFGPYGAITGASSDPYVDQNVWSPINGWHQRLHAYSPGHWRVMANMPAGNTSVVSFPNTGFFYNKSLSKFSSIVSSFNVTIPRGAGTDAEASYDIWFNNSPIDEIMIQNDYSPGRSPSCGTWTAQRVQFGGSDGVPAHPWDLCVSGSTAYWETANGNMPHGKINVLAMLNWLVKHGQLPNGVELTGFSYGVEISSTGGARELFRVRSFSAAAR